MAGKQWIKWAAMGAMVAATGCCRFCEHWCGPEHPAQQCCQPCQPCCVPCCPPGTVPSHYQPTQPVPQPVPGQPGQPGQTWNRTFTQPVSYNNCCQ